MNYKQKLGYMVLGAIVTLLRVAVSTFSPSLNTQRRGGHIVSTGLAVVDGKGNKAIRLTVVESRNYIIVYDKTGKKVVGVHPDGAGHGVVGFDKMGDIKWEAP